MMALAPFTRYSGSTAMIKRSSTSVVFHFSTFSIGHQPKGKSRPSRVFLRASENEGNDTPKPTILSLSLVSTTHVIRLGLAKRI